MEDFEQQLRNALARKDEPTSFEAKVFAAIAAGKPAPKVPWHWEALAASVLVVAGVWGQHQQSVRERAAGEAAKARLQLALKVTVTELSKIQQTVRTSTEDE